MEHNKKYLVVAIVFGVILTSFAITYNTIGKDYIKLTDENIVLKQQILKLKQAEVKNVK